MAAVSTVLMGLGAATQLGMGIHNTNQGKKDAKRAQDRIDNYKMPELKNSYAGLSVPTQGYDLAKQATLQSQANSAGALSQMGAQGAGFVGVLSDSTRNSVNDISSALTSAEFNMKQMMANDEGRLRNIKEARAQGDLAGLGSQAAFGQTQQMYGQNQIMNGAATGLEAVGSSDLGDKKLWGSNKPQALYTPKQ